MRTAISSNHLAMLAYTELRAHINQHSEFTAYDITRAIRASHQNFEIPHNSVRALVHHYMNGVVNSGHYQECLMDFGGRVAIFYAPMLMLAVLDRSLAAMN